MNCIAPVFALRRRHVGRQSPPFHACLHTNFPRVYRRPCGFSSQWYSTGYATNRFWATVCKTIRPMLSDRCLSVLYVTLVYVVMAKRLHGLRSHLVRRLALAPTTVLDGDPAPPSPQKKGHSSPHFSAHFALARSPISATAELLLQCLNDSCKKACAHEACFCQSKKDGYFLVHPVCYK